MNSDIGVIFHWGLYSVPAFDNVVSARRRKTQNGSEWYLKRLIETGNYRPIAGWKETQEYHKNNFGSKPYSDFKDDFKAENWNPDDWMLLCKSIGASYVIITTKHHCGFCLWNTKTTSYNSVESAAKKDILQMFSESAKKHGLKFGVYYSLFEFEKSCTKNFIDTVMYPQLLELIKYKPEIWWFDGDWMCKSEYSNKKIRDFCDLIHKENPEALINDRIGKSKSTIKLLEDPNELGKADYRVYQDRFIPKETPKVKWEHINTIGLSWGRNKSQTEKDYKSAEDLKKLYEEVSKKNGRFLINLGPNSDGTLDPIEGSILRKFTK